MTFRPTAKNLQVSMVGGYPKTHSSEYRTPAAQRAPVPARPSPLPPPHPPATSRSELKV